MPNAPLEDASRLIADVVACYERARRYRALAATCEERYLDRAVAIGTALRAWARDGEPDACDVAAANAELRALVADCERAIATVHASAAYRAAVAAWDADDLASVAARAPEVFDGVSPHAEQHPLYVPVSLASRRRGGEHFLAPHAVADGIERLLRDGFPASDPPPPRGADDRIRAVVFDDEVDTDGTPITLELAAAAITLPRFQLEPLGDVLVYAPRVRAAARVRCAAHVADEWWAVRPEAYTAYVTELTRELGGRSIEVIRA